MLISFSWTVGPLLAGVKTLTWREWDDAFAAKFRPGQLVDAWDRGPRQHGKKVATIKIISVAKMSLADLSDDDYEAEGLGWLARHPEACPKTIWGQKFQPYFVSREHFDQRRRDGEQGYAIRFDLVEVG